MPIFPDLFKNIKYNLWSGWINPKPPGSGLGTLTLDQTKIPYGTPSTGLILGGSDGGIIAASGAPPGFSVDSVGQMWGYDGTGTIGKTSFILTEENDKLNPAFKDSTIALEFYDPLALPFGVSVTTFYRGNPAYTFIVGTKPGDVITAGALPKGFTIDIPNLLVFWDGNSNQDTAAFTLTRTPTSGPAETVIVTIAIKDVTVTPSPDAWVGINIGGLEQYIIGGSAAPQQADPKSYTNAANRNLMFVRQTTRWERFQPVLYGGLDGDYLQKVKTACQRAHDAGQKWILDVHNYSGYNNGITQGKIGGGTITIDHYIDFIKKLAAAMKGTPGYYGLDFMNEPSQMPSLDINAKMMQAAINAVRDPNGVNDQNVVLYIECNNYSSAWSFDDINPGLETLTDPANRFLIMVHMYPDIDDSGTGTDFADKTYRNPYLPYHLQVLGGAIGPTAPKGLPVGPNIGVQRMGNVFNKIISYKFPVVDGFLFCLGEHGIPCDTQAIGRTSAPYGDGTPADDAAWRVEADNTLTWCKSHGVQVFLWQAGPQVGYTYDAVDFQNLEPDDSNLQRIQMAVVTKHTGAPEPTVFRFDAPQYCDVGVASAPCRITYRGNITTPSVFTPSDNGAGGFFTPASITMPVGTNFVANFTYTAASEQRIVLSVGNSAGLTAIISPSSTGGGTPQTPGTIICSSISAANDIIRAVIQSGKSPQVLLSRTHLLNNAWIGPVLQLARVSDSATRDFYARSLSDPRVDIQAIADWAGTASNTASNLVVNIVYDQSGNGGHEYATSNGYRAAYVLDGGNGYPIEKKGSNTKSSFGCAPEGNDMTVIFDAFWQKGNYQLQFTANIGGSIGLAGGGNFVVHTGTYPDGTNNTAGNYFSVPNALQTDTFHTYVYRFQHDTTNGLQAFRDGTLTGQSTTSGGTMTWSRYSCDVGWFRFYDINTRGTAFIRNIVISTAAYTDAEIAKLTALCTNPYKTPWPAVSSANYPPIIVQQTNPVWSARVGHPMAPFASSPTVANADGAMTIGSGVSMTIPDGSNISATILLSAANGTLTGPNLTQDSVNPLLYHLPSDTATNVAKALTGASGTAGVLFTPTTAAQTTFTLTILKANGVTTSNSSTVVTSVPVDPILPPYPAPVMGTMTTNLRGVNLSGGSVNTSDTRGYGYGYFYGYPYEWTYWCANAGVIRMGVTNRRLQPNNFGPLNEFQFNPQSSGPTGKPFIKGLIDQAAAAGVYVLIDLHQAGNFWIDGQFNGTTSASIGWVPEATAACVDYYTRMATRFLNYPNVIWGIMNEPGGMSATENVNSQIAMYNAIRATGSTQMILMSATNYSSATGWASGQNTLWDAWLATKPTNFAFEMHHYLDGEAGGVNAWVKQGFGATMLVSATAWCRARGVKAFLGEFGWNYSDANVAAKYPVGNSAGGSNGVYGVPSVEGQALVSYMKANADVWLGGAFFIAGPKLLFNNTSYVTGMVPTYDSNNLVPVDPPQLAILKNYWYSS
jgi:endoglucanase